MDGLFSKIWDWAVKNGLALPFILWFLWEKNQERLEAREIEGKKKDGTYKSWDSMDGRISNMEGTISEHLKKEAQEDINTAVIIGRISNLEGDSKHLFNQHSTIFQKIDSIEKKIDDKFEILNSDIKQILLEMKK